MEQHSKHASHSAGEEKKEENRPLAPEQTTVVPEAAPIAESAQRPATPNNLSIPLSIIFAGALIAGAIIMTDKGSTGTAGTAAQGAPQQVSARAMSDVAASIGIDKSKFTSCVTSGKYQARVDRDFQEGASIGVGGTPYSIVYDKKTGKQAPIGGALPFASIKTIIDSVMSQTGAVQKDPNAKDAPASVLAIKTDDHVNGDPTADLIIIEYTDLECPFCMRFHDTMLQVLAEYEKTGKIAWVHRHFPLSAIHSDAEKYAEGSECVYEQGGNAAFWKFADAIFSTEKSGGRVDSTK